MGRVKNINGFEHLPQAQVAQSIIVCVLASLEFNLGCCISSILLIGCLNLDCQLINRVAIYTLFFL